MVATNSNVRSEDRPELGSDAVTVEMPAFADEISMLAMPPVVVATPFAGSNVPRVAEN